MKKRKFNIKINFIDNRNILLKQPMCAIACLSMLAFSTNVCSAEEAQYIPEGYYIGANLGLAMASDSDVDDTNDITITESIEWDNGYAINASFGYDFGNDIRIEGEIGYQENDADKIKVSGGTSATGEGDISNTSFLINGYFDMNYGGPIVPSLSIGIGIANLDINEDNVDDTVLAYQMGVGFGYMVSETVTIDLKYRYFATEDPDFGDGIEIDYSTHNVYLGVRMRL